MACNEKHFVIAIAVATVVSVDVGAVFSLAICAGACVAAVSDYSSFYAVFRRLIRRVLLLPPQHSAGSHDVINEMLQLFWRHQLTWRGDPPCVVEWDGGRVAR